MNRTPATTVIGICGPPGCGKTSLALALTRTLSDTSAVFFDHYEKVTEQPLGDIVQWVKDGADCNVFTIPGLAEDLERLKRGVTVTDPGTGQPITPAKYLVFETPFGREHRATGRHIDLLVWIDVPLDVALARNVRVFTNGFLKESASPRWQDNLRWLSRHMDEYLGMVRGMLVTQREVLGGAADITIDGERAIGEVTQLAAREIMLAVARREAG